MSSSVITVKEQDASRIILVGGGPSSGEDRPGKRTRKNKTRTENTNNRTPPVVRRQSPSQPINDHVEEADDEWVQKRRGPRTAWSDNVQQEEQEDDEGQVIQEGNVESTSGEAKTQDCSDGNEDDDDSSGGTTHEHLLNELKELIDVTDRNVSNWSEQRKTAQTGQKEVSRELDKRVKEIKAALMKYVETAKQDAVSNINAQVDELSDSISTSENNLKKMRKIYDKYSQMDDAKQPDIKLKRLVVRARQQCKKVSAPPPWCSPIKSAPESQVLTKLIEALLGLRDTDAVAAAAAGGDGGATDAAQGPPSSDAIELTRLRGVVMETPKLVQTVSCRWKKDKQACGITDVVLTDDGLLFAVDRHNKVVKVFRCSQGKYKLLPVVGHKILQKPSRLSYVVNVDQVVVTEDETHELRLFSASDGSDLGQMKLPTTSTLDRVLTYPVAHCQLNSQQMAAVDFDTKSVVVWNTVDGQLVKTFKTGMDCPAYMTATSRRLLAITDWKTSCLKMFDATTGLETCSFPRASSTAESDCKQPSEDRQLSEPHGVCADKHGLVFVADRRQHSVRVFTEFGGQSLVTYTDQQHKIGVPYAIACNSQGLLAIAEYAGTVRIYSYCKPDAADSTS